MTKVSRLGNSWRRLEPEFNFIVKIDLTTVDTDHVLHCDSARSALTLDEVDLAKNID